MTREEIEAALQIAFRRCKQMFYPLSQVQQQILQQILVEELANSPATWPSEGNGSAGQEENPLDELTSEQRQSLLEFVKEQEQHNRPWKVRLLNDWLHNRDSGSVQFIREQYGPAWLNRVKPIHLAKYFEQQTNEDGLRLKVGDRIEVSNGLWEWVQEDGPCAKEWFPCTVVSLSEDFTRECNYHTCTIRFDNGAEFEIQGIYQWNRYNWRWAQES